MDFINDIQENNLEKKSTLELENDPEFEALRADELSYKNSG